MEKIQDIHNSIYSILKKNADLKKYVTNIYDYLLNKSQFPM